MDLIEITATITGILAVFLQTREKIVAWPLAVISVALSALVFAQERLYSDFLLHLIYVGLNIYGWIYWSRAGLRAKDQRSIQLISNSGIWLIWIFTAIMSMTLGSIMRMYTDADLPYFDAFTTVASLVAQFLLAKKFLYNWIIWIIVDVVAIPIYWYKGLYFFTFLFLVYLTLCVYGYIRWKAHLQNGHKMRL